MQPAIRIDNLSKSYRIGRRQGEDYQTLRETIATSAVRLWQRGRNALCRQPVDERREEAGGSFWALREVSSAIMPGEVVGIVGRNGAGKSTLLKILCRITEPTGGRVELRGRVGSILEVGTGFHSELTGRENIYLNGAILGMTRREIARKFDEIAAFAEIGPFLDTPVKRYSSGMYVRLAFAVASHLESEILIVDEVLAVGDQAFQKKCLGKMDEVRRSGRTVLFVSHNVAAVASLCQRCLFLHRGRLEMDGETSSILDRYHALDQEVGGGVRDLTKHAGRTRDSLPVLVEAGLLSERGEPAPCLPMGSPAVLRVRFRSRGGPIRPVLRVVVKTRPGTPIFGVGNRFQPGFPLDEPHEAGTIFCRFDRLPLTPGTYVVDLTLLDLYQELDAVHEAVSFEITPADVFGTGKLPPASLGPVYWPAAWSFERERANDCSLVRP